MLPGLGDPARDLVGNPKPLESEGLPGPPKGPKEWALYCLQSLFWDVGPVFWAPLEVPAVIWEYCFYFREPVNARADSPTHRRRKVCRSWGGQMLSAPVKFSLCFYSVPKYLISKGVEACILRGQSGPLMLPPAQKDGSQHCPPGPYSNAPLQGPDSLEQGRRAIVGCCEGT